MVAVTLSPSPELTPIVFIVDDDISVRESLELLISTVGLQPEAFASARKSSSLCAVMAMMGMFLSASFWRINFVAVTPSISGNVRSMRITSGFSRTAVSTAT